MGARALSRAYLHLVEREALPPPEPPRSLDVCVVSFSGERDLAEQAASLRSFLRRAGAPRRYVVVSDGTHTRRSRRLLAGLHPCVELADVAGLAPARVPAAVARYARHEPLGKKLVLELALPIDGPTLYVDADVLFFAATDTLVALIAADGPPRYLRDCGPYFDTRLLDAACETVDPTNAGVLLVRRPLEWEDALARFDALRGRPVFHTEQTILHLALRASDGVPLDPRRFVVSVDDRYEPGDRFATAAIALRHYTTPVRDKLLVTAVRAERGCGRARHAARARVASQSWDPLLRLQPAPLIRTPRRGRAWPAQSSARPAS